MAQSDLPRAGRGGQHHVLARQDLEQRLLLCRIQGQPQRGHVAEELLQDLVSVHRPRWRGEQRSLASIGSRAGHGHFTWATYTTAPQESGPEQSHQILTGEQFRHPGGAPGTGGRRR